MTIFTMEMYRSEGVILHTLKFRDYDQIITLFSLEEGVIKLILKGAFSKKWGNGTKTALFTQAEFVYQKRNSELYVCKEVSVVDQHLHLRDSLPNLETACDIAKTLLSSQLLQKPAPDLYKLFLYYLKKIPHCLDPYVLAASFRLKLLRHDGLLGMTPECSVCQTTLLHYYVQSGESYCQQHAGFGALELNINEAQQLFQLALAQSFASLAEMRLEKSLQAKILRLFSEQIQT